MVLQLTVADVMTQPVLRVTADTSLQDAVQLISDPLDFAKRLPLGRMLRTNLIHT